MRIFFLPFSLTAINNETLKIGI